MMPGSIICDFGDAGDDKGKGGKYLLVPPGYKGEIPDGYFVRKSKTYGHWLAMRGFMENFDPDPVVKNMKDHFRLYPLGSKPKEVKWVNTAMKDFSTLHAQDLLSLKRSTRRFRKSPIRQKTLRFSACCARSVSRRASLLHRMTA